MHVLILFLLLAVVALGSQLKLLFLRKASDSGGYSFLYFIILATPALATIVMVTTLNWHMFTDWEGFLWDEHFIFHLTVWLAEVITVGVLLLSLGQNIITAILVRRYPKATDPALISLANRVAAKLKVRCPTLRIYESSRPVALSGGIMRNSKFILLSSWMVSNLDEEEKEAVLAHELAHIRHHDSLITLVARLLYNIAFYLPASRKAWQRLQIHIEMLCDRMTTEVTGRPLALASALLKAAAQDLDTKTNPRWALSNRLTGNSLNQNILGRRLEVLLGKTQLTRTPGTTRSGWHITVPIVGIVVLEAIIISFFLYVLCCVWGNQNIGSITGSFNG